MIAPLLVAGLVVLGIAAATAISKLVAAGKDAEKNFSSCPVGSPSGTCPLNSGASSFAERKAQAIQKIKDSNFGKAEEGKKVVKKIDNLDKTNIEHIHPNGRIWISLMLTGRTTSPMPIFDPPRLSHMFGGPAAALMSIDWRQAPRGTNSYWKR